MEINLSAMLFFAMMGSSYSPIEPPNGFSDSFITNEFIDLNNSKNAIIEKQRTLVHPERKLGQSILHEPFDSLNEWKSFSSGSGRASIEPTNETDSAVGKYTLKLSTGSKLGSKAGVSKSGITVPSSFGILIIPDVEGLADSQGDPLEMTIKNRDNKLVRVRFFHGSLRVYVNNEWVELSNHIKAYPKIHGPEWWIEVKKIEGETYNASVYVGTQRKGEVTGVLPDANSATTPDLQFFQSSNTLPNRVSRVSIVEIGETQRAQDMTLISMARLSKIQPSSGCIALALEDVSVALNPNTNLMASLSRNNGITWESVQLKDIGDFGWGELGTKKRIHLLAGCTKFVSKNNGKKIRYKIETTGGDFFVLQNATIYWQ